MSESHQREAAIFDAAMERPPEERAAHLDEACAGDPALRRRLEALLKACDSACDFLNSPADPGGAGPTSAALPSFEKPGDRLGRYKLLEQIGEGGCGVVYVAEQTEPVRRRVAIKIIKLGMDTKSVIARFEAERQALALMDHPSIAKILDAGTTGAEGVESQIGNHKSQIPHGRPYFVMELVRGMRITDYCDEKRLSTKARLDLFVQVCQAIQHAHQKGIIHRDIKPSNILVTVNDGVPVPKVIDFGIAKATSGQLLTDKTVYTAFEQFIGTPAYMSPEQATLTSLDIDTRSDIYALGVLLYELLTGKTPFDAKELLGIGLDAMRRTIREQEPPRPSLRLSTLPGQELSTAAQRRGLDAPKLVSELRGDLDWIVMKALEKDRARRYETANGLAMDVQRHLNNEPVAACPPSRIYRLQKAVRRNKLAFAAGSAVAVSLVIGLTLSTVLFFRERAARQRADEQAAIARAVNDFLQLDVLRQADSRSQAEGHFAPDPNLTVRKALDRAAARLGDRFKDQPMVEAAVRTTIGYSLSAVGEAEQAIEHLQRAMQLRRANLGPNHPGTLGSMNNLANAFEGAGRFDQALPLLEETVRLLKANLGPDHPDTLRSMYNLAWVYRSAGKRDQARPLLEETLKLMKTKLGPDNVATLRAMNALAIAQADAGNFNHALPLFEETLKLLKSKLGLDHPEILNLMNNLALAYGSAGKRDQALPLHEETLKLRKVRLGPDHPDTLGAMNNLAMAYAEAGKLDHALPLYEEALTLTKASLGPNHPDTLGLSHNLALALASCGKLPEAEVHFRETLERRRKLLGNEHADVAASLGSLAVVLARQGKLAEAETGFREALDLLRVSSTHPARQETPLLGVVLCHLANALRERKMLGEARSLAEQATTLYQRHADWPSGERQHASEVLHAVLKETGDWVALTALFREEANKGDAAAMNNLAWLLATSRDPAIRDGASAVTFAEQAIERIDRNDQRYASWLDTLAAAYAEAGDFAKAVRAQRQAVDLAQNEEWRNGFASRLKLYESSIPFRE